MKIYGGFSWPRPLKGSLLLASMFGCSILGNIARDILKEKMRKPRQRGEGPGEFTVLSTIFNFRDLYIYIYIPRLIINSYKRTKTDSIQQLQSVLISALESSLLMIYKWVQKSSYFTCIECRQEQPESTIR